MVKSCGSRHRAVECPHDRQTPQQKSQPNKQKKQTKNEETNKQTNKQTKYFASRNPHPPHSRAYDHEHGCVNSSMFFEWLWAYDCSTSFALRALSIIHLSACVKLHLPASRSRELKHRFRQQKPSPFQKNPDGGLTEVAYSQPKATQKHHPFRGSGYTQNTKAPT